VCRPVIRPGQHRSFADRVAVAAAEVYERGLAVAVDRRQVRLDHGDPARRAQPGQMTLGEGPLGRVGEAVPPSVQAAGADRRLDDPLAIGGKRGIGGWREPPRRHDPNPRAGQLGEITLVGVPGHRGRVIGEPRHGGGPGQELVVAPGVVPRRPQHDEREATPVDAGVIPHRWFDRVPALPKWLDRQPVVVVQLRQRGARDERDGSHLLASDMIAARAGRLGPLAVGYELVNGRSVTAPGSGGSSTARDRCWDAFAQSVPAPTRCRL
jgi:hypothetical protein